MSRWIVLDEIHVRLLIPQMPDAESQTIWAAVVDPSFDADLLRAVRRILRRRPVLNKVRVRIYR
jgi:hypothetical protein